MSVKSGRAQYARKSARRQAPFSGTAILLRFMVRRDRIRATAWIVGIGCLGFYFAHAIQFLAETEDELRTMTTMFTDPLGRMISGPGFGMENPTHERLFSGGYVLYLYLFVGLMSIFTVVRHTRLEEQTGRAELIRANVVGRHATLTAALLLAGICNLVVGLLIWIAALSADYAVQGSLLVAIGACAVGLFFAGIATVAAQLSESSRAASGIAGATLGLAFLVRMGGDAAEPGGSTLSWFSPLAWAQQTAPYVEDRWWPLLIPTGFAILLVWLGYWLSTTRDVGASLVPTRLGPRVARPLLGTPQGLALHTLKGTLTGWVIALLLASLMFGSFAQTVVDVADDLPPEMAQVFAGEDMLRGYLAYIAVFMTVFIGAAGVSGLHQVRGEENSGRAEYAMSAPVSRTAWLGAHLGVLILGVLLIQVVVGVGMGLGASASLDTEGDKYFGELLLAGIVQAPAVLALIGVVVGLLGWLPKIALAVGWFFVGFGTVMSTFGQLLELPDALANLDLFGHLAEYPVEQVELAPIAVLLAIAVGGIVIGLIGWNRRQVNCV